MIADTTAFGPSRSNDAAALSRRDDRAERASRILREPNAIVGTDGDPIGAGIFSAERELGRLTACRDAAERVAAHLGKPKTVVRCDHDVHRKGSRARGEELGDFACRRDSSDLARVILRKPERAVGPADDRERLRVSRREGELGQLPARGKPPDSPAHEFGEQSAPSGPVTILQGPLSGCNGRTWNVSAK